MSFEEFAAARQLLVEEQIGTLLRQAKAQENRAASKVRQHVARQNGAR